MRPSWRRGGVRAAAVLAGVGLAGALGCGWPGPRTHAVKGKVELAGRPVKELAGGHVEAVLADDHRVEASGEIQPDGSFELQTVYDGEVLSGARAGEYQVRVVLSDEDGGAGRRRQGPALAPRFTRFKTSGLSFQVPGDGELVLRVSPR